MLRTMDWNRKHIERCHPVRSLETFTIECTAVCLKETSPGLIKEYSFILSKALILFLF